MATRKKTAKKTAKKAAKKTTARKTTKKPAPKKAAASSVKRIPGSATVRTKSQITNSIVDATGMTRKEVNTVFEAFEALTVADLKKGTDVKFMGMKLTVKKKPATKARKGITDQSIFEDYVFDVAFNGTLGQVSPDISPVG